MCEYDYIPPRYKIIHEFWQEEQVRTQISYTCLWHVYKIWHTTVNSVPNFTVHASLSSECVHPFLVSQLSILLVIIYNWLHFFMTLHIPNHVKKRWLSKYAGKTSFSLLVISWPDTTNKFSQMFEVSTKTRVSLFIDLLSTYVDFISFITRPMIAAFILSPLVSKSPRTMNS